MIAASSKWRCTAVVPSAGGILGEPVVARTCQALLLCSAATLSRSTRLVKSASLGRATFRETQHAQHLGHD